MKIADVKTMRAMDEKAINEYGIPGIILMENAALALLKHMDLNKKYFVIVAGKGNNGGDGFALARQLKNLGKEVDLFYVSDRGEPEGDARVFYNMVTKLQISIENVTKEKNLWLFQDALEEADVIIDGLLGTGLSGELSPFLQEVINTMNYYHHKIISIDVPSGLLVDEGKPNPVAIKAKKTVTFECMKKGFLAYSALPYLGETKVVPIGIPEQIKNSFVFSGEIITKKMAQDLLPVRKIIGHKNTYGHVLVVAGSPGFTGAALLSSRAALVTGAGLVSLYSHEKSMETLVLRLTEIMSLNEDKLEDGVKNAQVVAFGPGLGNTRDTQKLLMRVIKTLHEEGKTDATLVIDADGLNVLKTRLEILKPLCFQVILTPHPGEMERLTGKTKLEIEENRMEIAKRFAKEYGVILVLKGYHTVVTDGDKVYVNQTGSSAMAQGGMGDVLTGIIASLAGQGLPAIEAAALGVYLHGGIGDELAKNQYSIKASEIIDNIPFFMKKLQS
ncbi:MAG: NAD(P)H-hydrate dehydratase [Clostridium sp.]|nr:NAD(P)H-hydrate dehydratase [Clostridium sp.]